MDMQPITMSRYINVIVIILYLNLARSNAFGLSDIKDSLMNTVYDYMTSSIKAEVNKVADEVLQYLNNGDFKKRVGLYEDKFLNCSQLISKYGYRVEEHTVVTEDGYILKLVRIPNEGPSVILSHGLFVSSDSFLISGHDKALAYVLANASYDVWLANVRGSKYSRAHKSLSPNEKHFWDFSWDDMGTKDAPAIIDHIIAKTGESKVAFVGHSQGSTIGYVMLSEKPEYNDKISIMISLGPAAWMSHVQSPYLQLLARFNKQIELICKSFDIYKYTPENLYWKILSNEICGSSPVTAVVCTTFLFPFYGFDYFQLDLENLSVHFSHNPNGCSIKQVLHFLQSIATGDFKKYDYGEDINKEVYGSEVPPSYPIQKITTKMAFFYGENDWTSSYDDLIKFSRRVQSVVGIHKVPYKYFNHIDFLWAKDVKTLLYDNVIEVLDKFVKDQPRDFL